MGLAFRVAHRRAGQVAPRFPPMALGGLGRARPLGVCGQIEPRLAPADQFQIDRRQQVRIDQRAMLVANGEVDFEPLAQGVETGAGAGKLLPCDQDGIDRAGVVERIAAGPGQLGIHEFQIEGGGCG